jgi:hypothetical protein
LEATEPASGRLIRGRCAAVLGVGLLLLHLGELLNPTPASRNLSSWDFDSAGRLMVHFRSVSNERSSDIVAARTSVVKN